ncbi:MAG: hypothetical protein FJ276_03435 [Planctomycetes bacterium]|nr:hypothetical protein [Planctomycetota bacterium]
MPTARMIVCERSEKWTVALRRGLGDDMPRLLETRSLDACWREVAANPGSFVVVECLETNLEQVARWLKRLSARFPGARAAVVSERGLQPCEWLLREAGAVHVAFSTRETGPLVRILRRHMAAMPAPDTSLRQQLWDRLPWGGEFEG